MIAVLHWLRLCYCVYGLVGYRLVLRAQAYEGQIAAGGGSTSSSELINSLYFQVQPADLYVIEGETAELKCQLKPHTDAGPVQWAKDGFLLGKCLPTLCTTLSTIANNAIQPTF